ncbi:redoxin domain-containing protein [Oceanobacillus sp. 143]|uniref:Glutathione peroxidase n=1 Tax=Oceanobacillus zhaokaii TaxID=2052660 RepID=A0A345PDB5_9BACI|nr:glutathione peroxidase [Oceanobacillus zhaokaii]AXI07995.1 glutathione peroxidase [Oceanobacillus zhaokaii]QGS68020.1 redoxin domain-containing protein [Oceanobacillus sp. 143]
MSVHGYSVLTMDGNEKSLADYKGKVLLIVNTASECGFTPQFEGLQRLYEKYKEQDFIVLGFPCNQFGNQDPGTNEDIASFCQKNYGVSFPMFSKIDVKGENADRLFSYLIQQAKGLITEQIKWNFTKFLIDKNGKVVDRFAPQKKPEAIEKEIEALLQFSN